MIKNDLHSSWLRTEEVFAQSACEVILDEAPYHKAVISGEKGRFPAGKGCRTLVQTGTAAEPSDASDQIRTDALCAHQSRSFRPEPK